VRPDFEAWNSEKANQRLAKHLASNLNNMAARTWSYWKKSHPININHTSSEGKYRDFVISNICDDFALIRDIADAHKHVELNRDSRRITRSSQTDSDSIKWDEGCWDEARWDSPEELIITLDDGSKRTFEAVANRVMNMWEELLQSWNL
ncbi:hypothetical protein, partial [Thalassobaculum salexigens]|uniref:hypothetical protein n=1 Tax=Thalassobaculum salexigens TaxID=455360 RepID=UPI00248E006B